jgi:hypothetical protein
MWGACRRLDIFSSADAGVDQASVGQSRKRISINTKARALEKRAIVVIKPKPAQIGHRRVSSACLNARAIKVFDAQK